MSNTNDGGPAFPGEDADKHYRGMSLRDYFAAKAMEGDIASKGLDITVNAEYIAKRTKTYYNIADEMIKARKY
ncbi:hypothetical protein PZO64_22650 [Pantoea vagans]|uniref:hypothetical protein n=1 Tax=Pantoea vagans TaxID=470934 RepID=UPI0023B19546|nr:hypothetical protein [Pantoea vagans]MDE8559064.1 hypothetical protein [Pantoea vagans]